ncbi:MAG TPA: site-2 protease family protein [Chitinophagaceae bacterium]|nr:site-2 protease family protein [Chitinophagaceae bacterium]
MFLIYYVVSVSIAFFINVAVHEFGHAIPMVLLTGKKAEVYLGSFGNKKSPFKFSTRYFDIWIKPRFIMGAGLCKATATKVSIKKQLIYIACGPLASLLLACTIFLFFPVLSPDLQKRAIPLAFFVASAAFFLVTVIPHETNILMPRGNRLNSDGYTLKQLWALRKYEKEYFEAFDYYLAKDYAKAAGLLVFLIDKKIQIRYLFSHALSALCLAKQHARAIELHDRVRGHVKFTADDYCNIGVARIRTGEYQCAIEELKKSLKLHPGHYISLNNIGYALTLMKRFDDSIPYFDKCISLKPDYVYAFNNRGYAKMQTGNLSDGLDDIKKSMELDDKNAYAYRNMAVYFMKIRSNDKALDFLYKAKALDEHTDMIDELISEAELRKTSNY